jgi:hypothetical protein
MVTLNLTLREIGTPLSSDAAATGWAAASAQDAHEEWHDSSLDLQRGLDILELAPDETRPRPAPAPEAELEALVLRRL